MAPNREGSHEAPRGRIDEDAEAAEEVEDVLTLGSLRPDLGPDCDRQEGESSQST